MAAVARTTTSNPALLPANRLEGRFCPGRIDINQHHCQTVVFIPETKAYFHISMNKLKN
jgi:hypothetical protein